MFYAHEGAVRRRHLQDQTEQAWCLTIATNAISTWTAEYLGLAVQQFRDRGRHIDDEILANPASDWRDLIKGRRKPIASGARWSLSRLA